MFNKEEKKAANKGIWQIFTMFLLATVLFGSLGTVTRYLGMWGDTTMERIITKNSFQYKEGMDQQAAIWESQLVELDEQLMTCQEQEICDGIQGQKRIIRARLRAVTINQ